MSAVAPFILPAIIGGGIGVAGKLLSKKPKAVQPTPQPTRIEARERAERNDILSRRTGTRANSRTGFGAGEAFTGPKKSLLGR